MKKAKEQLEAELIVLDLIRKNHLTPEECLDKARKMKESRQYAIAQRVTLTIILAILWDVYDDFDEAMTKQVYDLWLEYHRKYLNGEGNIFEQMVAVDGILDGQLLNDTLFDVVKEKGGANGEQLEGMD